MWMNSSQMWMRSSRIYSRSNYNKWRHYLIRVILYKFIAVNMERKINISIYLERLNAFLASYLSAGFGTFFQVSALAFYWLRKFYANARGK
jgi:hypothetical protein